MSKEKENSEPPNVISIAKRAEIFPDKIVPVLQHSRCLGSWGEVKDVNPKNRTYKINCMSCDNSVILDISMFVNLNQ